MVIYGRKEENVAGSKAGASGKVVIFLPMCMYAATLSPLLNGMFALLEVGWFYKYIFIWRGFSRVEGQSNWGIKLV